MLIFMRTFVTETTATRQFARNPETLTVKPERLDKSHFQYPVPEQNDVLEQ